MEEELQERRHWERIAWWLTTISVIPALVTAYVATAGTQREPAGLAITIMTLAATAWAAMLWNILWAGTASCRADTALAKRRAAFKTALGFGTAAIAMCGTAIAGFVWGFI